MVSKPLKKKTPKIHDANSAGDRPPWVPTAKITATGPVAEKITPIRPFAAYSEPKSRRSLPHPVRGLGGRSISGCLCAPATFTSI